MDLYVGNRRGKTQGWIIQTKTTLDWPLKGDVAILLFSQCCWILKWSTSILIPARQRRWYCGRRQNLFEATSLSPGDSRAAGHHWGPTTPPYWAVPWTPWKILIHIWVKKRKSNHWYHQRNYPFAGGLCERTLRPINKLSTPEALRICKIAHKKRRTWNTTKASLRKNLNFGKVFWGTMGARETQDNVVVQSDLTRICQKVIGLLGTSSSWCAILKILNCMTFSDILDNEKMAQAIYLWTSNC